MAGPDGRFTKLKAVLLNNLLKAYHKKVNGCSGIQVALTTWIMAILKLCKPICPQYPWLFAFFSPHCLMLSVMCISPELEPA
jgi:hypothetical protein